MKKVIAREDLCLDCKLCEVFCRTAHSESKDVVRAHLREDPVPVSRITVEGDTHDSVAVNCRHCDDPACVVNAHVLGFSIRMVSGKTGDF